MKRGLYFLLILAACAPYRKNPLSNSFHDMTAHYNSYFIAKERIKEIEQTIFDAQSWNYNKVLPIHPQFDSTLSASVKTQIDDCIQKSSISIQRHPESKWEDDSYILVGKARYYALELPDAVETFKYVNTKSDDDNSRHEALSELIRVFTEFHEYNNAQAVIDYLEKEELNARSKRIFHTNAAYLYQKKEDENKMVQHLVQAEDLIVRSSDKARINFIIGQTYHSLGFESEAFRYYKNVLRNNPNYELEFYSKLYMAQVTELAKDNDLKRIQKYFRSLLKDPKNEEYQDKIYYELAGFQLNNGRLEESIDSYKSSIRVSKSNQRQKAYSYLKLGEIYYDTIKNYSLAKSYYDSTVSVLPKDEDNYAEIKNRQEVLVDFVKQIEIIQKNDSLLHLATLPADSLLAFAIATLEVEDQKKKEKKLKEEKAEARRRQNSLNNNDELIQTQGSNAVWYFSNANALSKGRSEFTRKWGERELEDNWRRKNKTANAPVVGAPSDQTIVSTEETNEEVPIEQRAALLLTDIPKTQAEKDTLEVQIGRAYYQLGNIYNLRLEEDENAAESFEKLLQRFPGSEFEPEVLYQLFLLYKIIEPEQSEQRGQTLVENYPETIYAKLVGNPNYREESFAAKERLQKLYRDLYSLFKAGNNEVVIAKADSALAEDPENEFSDNIKLLQIMAIGKKDGNIKYQYELGNFPKLYPESELVPYASTLLTASEEFQKNRYNSAKARFIADFNQKHHFIVVYDIKKELTEKVPGLIDEFLKEKNLVTLNTGNLILNQEKTMVLVNEFPGKATAESFARSFEADQKILTGLKGEKIDVFVITEDNFDIFYKTKDVSAYLNFFEKYYQ